MQRKIYGIFVAGGQGTRMGLQTPKQFLDLGGVPVLQRSISIFVEACPGIQVITVLPKEHFETWKRLCIQNNFDCPQKMVEGGITRFHSVKNALAHVPDGAVVMIHDGVRPLISAQLVRSIAARMEECRAVIPVLPVTDTLKALEKSPSGDLVHSPADDPDRSGLFGAQTPQTFLSEDIKAAYGQGYDLAFTDDASVAARKEIPLTYVQGERLNIKITTQEDLVLAGAVLSLRERRSYNP